MTDYAGIKMLRDDLRKGRWRFWMPAILAGVIGAASIAGSITALIVTGTFS